MVDQRLPIHVDEILGLAYMGKPTTTTTTI